MRIVVHGAGIFGLSIAWACARRGADVAVFDPNGPGAGASGGLVGALAPHVPENWNTKKAAQFESLVMAESFWADVFRASGHDPGYARSGRLQPLVDEAAVDLARSRARAADDLWRGEYAWSVVPVTDYPGLLESASGLLVHDTLSARLSPRDAIRSLVMALAAKGVEVSSNVVPEGDAAVHATGVHGLTELNSLGAGRLVGAAVKGQAALLACDLRDRPQIYANGLHIVPHVNGTIAVGSTSERDWDDPSETDGLLEDVIARARAVCPPLRNAKVVARWAGLRPRTRSRVPMIGPHPLHDGDFIANGGFKIGFGMAPLVASLMADLVLDGVDLIPADFRPEASLS